MFAQVLVFQPGMYQGFTYLVPKRENLRAGDLVAVPFGTGNRVKKGLVLSLSSDHESGYTAKPVLGKYPAAYALSETRMNLLLWIRQEYFSPFYETARLFYPEYALPDFEFYEGSTIAAKENAAFDFQDEPDEFQLSIRQKQKKTSLLACEIRLVLPRKTPGKGAKKQIRIFDYLSEAGNWMSVQHVIEDCQLPSADSIKRMIKAGIIEVQVMEDLENLPLVPQEALPLTEAQDKILETIVNLGHQKPILLHGITGSGKTEIYFHLIDTILERGSSVLYLVPEIALTPQTIDRIKQRFNVPVAVLHSRLPMKERRNAWQAISKKQISIVLGTRSALFAPIDHLGGIIIDECHDQSYHSQATPRFRADEVACRLGEELKIPIILGSATPNYVQYHLAQTGYYTYLPLNERVQNARLPDVEVVDLREELKSGNRSMISHRLYEEMKETLARKEQAILFLNRRGFSGFISCRACGEVLKCSHCDVSLTYHHKDSSLRCHLCGRRFPQLKTCPNCGSTWLKPFSAGTQKLEAIVKRAFPEARLLRMDYDTTRNKESFETIYQTVKSGQCDIVIGTQMIAKGWDFPDVTLIGILAADLSLHISRHDAADRTFQLLDQVSGRAGRGKKAGHVVLQTYTPEHYAIQAVANHDATWFYHNEKEVRKALHFPPYGHLITIFATARKAFRLEEGIKKARKLFCDNISMTGVKIGEVIPSHISKADSLYRKEFIIQIPVVDMGQFRRIYFEKIESPLIGLRSEGCQISILWNEEA